MEKYDISGMSCAACSARVEKAVSNVDGVKACSVNLLTNSMQVEGTASKEAIIKAVEDAGYGASPSQMLGGSKGSSKKAQNPLAPMIKRLVSSAIILIVLMYFTMGHMLSFPLPSNPIIIAIVELVLTSAICFINKHFFISGFKAALNKAPNMDTLIALGASISYIWSLYELIMIIIYMAQEDMMAAHDTLMSLYFESAAMILTLITIGKTLEEYSKGKTTNALKGLMALQPSTVLVERDGVESLIQIDEVKVGDIFIVKPGENIPVDGIVIEGYTSINEASITGESIPVDKKVNDEVISGTSNLTSYIKCKATKVGKDTTLSQIIKLVEDASSSKAPIAKMADKVAGIFTPVILGIALIVFIAWIIASKDLGYSLERAITVLVISCPCALGLATPVAIMVSSGVGAKIGVLFKNATAIESAARVNIAVLDKTGTITLGEPQVKDIIPIGTTSDELLKNAVSIEQFSEHPLAKAIVSYAELNAIKPIHIENFEVLPGNGLKANIDSKNIYAGSKSYIENLANLDDKTSDILSKLANQGKTPILFARDNELLGIIAIQDSIKQDSKYAISELKDMGIKVYMLTGDNELTASYIAKEVGIDNVIANVKPQDKEAHVATLSKDGIVAMVGDGINDAPALTRANLGVAIGAGSDIAIDSADVVLVKNDLTSLVNTIKLGRKALLNIKENLFWAFIYNLICIPIAAGALIPVGITLQPMYGALAMSLSSFCVVMNALRLNLFKPTKHIFDDNKGEETMEKTITLNIEGMMCMHCEAHVKAALLKIEGVEVISVDHTKNNAVIKASKDIQEEIFKKAIEDAGYTYKGIA